VKLLFNSSNAFFHGSLNSKDASFFINLNNGNAMCNTPFEMPHVNLFFQTSKEHLSEY